MLAIIFALQLFAQTGLLLPLAKSRLPKGGVGRHINANTSSLSSDGSRLALKFTNLCADWRQLCGICTSAVDSPGLFGHEYAVMDLAGQPDTWETHWERCALEGVLNNDGLTYR